MSGRTLASDMLKIAEIKEFLERWPEAEFGPAHIVLSDHNFEPGHLSWCDGIIYAIQEERKLGGHHLYPEHSSNEIEATRRLLFHLLTGHPETYVVTSDPPIVMQRTWREVARV